MSAITYVLNQTRYYASLIRCSVRQVFERMGGNGLSKLCGRHHEQWIP